MTWLLLVLLCILCWSTTDLFYKKGSPTEDKQSHLKFLVWLGLVLGGLSVLLFPCRKVKSPFLLLFANTAIISLLRLPMCWP